jgi:uncharacterized protein (UPF0261 family)
MERMKMTLRQTITIAIALTLAIAGPALAQDIIGVQPAATAAVATMRAIGLAAIAFGFFRFMAGRHQIEGMVTLGIGALGVAKAPAIAAFMGL